MPYFSDFSIALRLALRARFLWLAGCALLVLGMAAVLAAMFSGRQPATVALDVGISVTRLLLPLVLVLMTQELLSREFERRYFLSSLTYPRPRQHLLFGRFFAVVVLGLILLLGMALLLGAVVWWVGQDYAQATPVNLGWHYLLVIAFAGLELLLLAAVASLLAVLASTPSFVLIGTFGFMLVARSFAAIVALLTRDAWLVGDAESYRAGVGLLGYLLPDLGALDVRMIALYGQLDLMPADWPLLLLSTLAYVVGLLGLAVWALQRKRFA
jgi:ABC-type transport system involved in multi-copper enzyme maturation permease subunit